MHLAEDEVRLEAQGRRLGLLQPVENRLAAPPRCTGVAIPQRDAREYQLRHRRFRIGLHIRETGVQLVIQTRSRAHADAVQAAIADAGYGVTRY